MRLASGTIRATFPAGAGAGAGPVWERILDRMARVAGALALLATRHGSEAGDAPASAADAARFDAVILPHLDAAYNLARYLSRDADAAQDIVQEAFLRAYRSFGDFRGENPRAWILAIVRNCHLSWRAQMRRAAPASPGAPTEDGGEEQVADADTPESLLLRRSEADLVRGVIERLPEALREVLVLREFDDLSYREISRVADVPLGTVMSRLARARRLFAQLWERASPAGGATRRKAAP